MGFFHKVTLFFMLLAINGCATIPTGPSVNVLPAQGKSFDAFRTEDTNCRQWAEQRIGAPTQQVYDTNVATGAVAGTAIGTGLGAAIGSASGNAGAGALIGAMSGLLVGTTAGSDSGRRYGREAQRRYDNAYVQCMYSYGNKVPGNRLQVVAVPPKPVVSIPPPPPVAMVPPPPPVPSDYMVQADMPSAGTPSPPVLLPKIEQYSPPSEIYVDEAPQFIYSPTLSLYVAVGVPYDLAYNGVDYFYFYGGRWYRGPFYDGPWVLATGRYFPPVLLRYRIDKIRFFRDLEFKRYEHNRAHYDGRFHRPDFRGERRKVAHKEEHR